MDGFTPTFFLQIVIAIGTAGAVYGAIKADLRNMHERMDEEREAAKAHRKEDDESFHDIRDKIGGIAGRVARMEGANDLGEQIVSAMRK
jgi:hypothetical protein